ncbi:MAG: HD domain-containing protein [Anaerolineae bacterium]|nr:HD domain-containing protein [Anaerolineae bacterium]
MPTVEDAISLAVRAHAGQKDRYGQPYILHVIRVVARVFDAPAQMAAALHDVVEDTAVTTDELRLMGYSEAVLAAVDCLTRRNNESYEQFIERIAPNPLAVRVKLADLEDNMDLRRGGLLRTDDLERVARYQRAWKRLTTGGAP